MSSYCFWEKYNCHLSKAAKVQLLSDNLINCNKGRKKCLLLHMCASLTSPSSFSLIFPFTFSLILLIFPSFSLSYTCPHTYSHTIFQGIGNSFLFGSNSALIIEGIIYVYCHKLTNIKFFWLWDKFKSLLHF